MAAQQPQQEEEEAKLHRFLRWLQANGAELRGCTIRRSGPNEGFGIFSTSSLNESDHGVLMVVPLDLAITPMRVLQDPTVGPACRALYEQGGTDDRFLVMLFLMVERLRNDSLWKPYLDLLPENFGCPLWFTDDELSELKETTLYLATNVQKKALQAHYDNTVKDLVEEIFHSLKLDSTREVQFEDYLWANSVFWTRALSIPMPHSYVFPSSSVEQDNCETSNHEQSRDLKDSVPQVENNCSDEISKLGNSDSVMVEGLVPGIDFCNHGLEADAGWEIDATGTVTGMKDSMYLVLGGPIPNKVEKEILISYGDKGNEELLYLYGFVIDENPYDFIMVHRRYPAESLDEKKKLLEIQNAEWRCIMPKNLLDHGFFSNRNLQDEGKNVISANQSTKYSWSGNREVPSYLNRLVFPREFITTLRTVSMNDEQLNQVSSLLAEVVGNGEDQERQPSDKEVQTAIWEVCGDYGAFNLLIEILRSRLIELEEGTGTQESDDELLNKFRSEDVLDSDISDYENERSRKNYWSSLVYRKGQKLLTKLFLREAEHLLHLCAKDQS